MTTFEDRPLQSRRALREGERAQAAAGAAAPPGLVAPGSPIPPAPPAAPARAAGFPAAPDGPGEPLSYVTQNRPPLPGYGTPAPAAPAPVATPAVAAPPAPAAAPAFRPRDFSPEGRAAPPPLVTEVPAPGVVEYQTQARAAVPVPGSLAASLAGQPTEQTLSRRELRALREAAEGAGVLAAAVAPAAPVVPDAPGAYAADPAVPPSAGDAGRRGRRSAPGSAPDGGLGAIDAMFGPGAIGSTRDRVPGAAAVAPPAPVPEVAAADPVLAPVAEVAPASPEPESVTTGERPAGHWTRQAEDEGIDDLHTGSVTRGVGSTTLTTSALVLPSMPAHDFGTGEVLLTSSLALPASLGATGAVQRLDEPDIDHLLDPVDRQPVAPASGPIKATSAVSSHTHSRSVIAAPTPARSSRGVTVLIASASVMVVVVVGLLIVAVATGGL